MLNFLENIDIITSRKNPFLLKMASLKEKKYREIHQLFLIEGEKLFREAVQAGIVPDEILIAEGKYEKLKPVLIDLFSKFRTSPPRVTCFSDECFEKISTEKAPEGVIAVAKYLDFFEKCIKIDGRQLVENTLPAHERSIVLYDVRDPGNLGAVMRSSLAFGVERVILAGSCVDIYNPKTVRASMGALFHLKYMLMEDIAPCIAYWQKAGRRVLAAELTERSISIEKIGLNSCDILVIGNEGHGIPRAISALCDGGVYIPISSCSESLNASVAASILLWEQVRTDTARGDGHVF